MSEDKNEYDNNSSKVAQYFIENFKKYGREVEYLEKAGPSLVRLES